MTRIDPHNYVPYGNLRNTYHKKPIFTVLYENLLTVPGTETRGRGDFIFSSEVS